MKPTEMKFRVRAQFISSFARKMVCCGDSPFAVQNFRKMSEQYFIPEGSVNLNSIRKSPNDDNM